MQRRASRPIGLLPAVVLFLAACNLQSAPSAQTAQTAQFNPAETAVSIASPSGTAAAPSATPKPLDLSHHPLYWFGPLPPMVQNAGRPFIGSTDFMDLFTPDAAWKQSASEIQVFKLYGEWVAANASDAQLRQVVNYLRERGLALAVEAGALGPSSECGQGVEGFAGIGEGLRLAQRIQAAGGRIDILALDEPYFFAHFYDGPNACHWPAEKVAQGVDRYIQYMRGQFPGLIVGDTEPVAEPARAADYQAWLDTWRRVNGYDPAFLHLDMDWSSPTWPTDAKAIEDYGRRLGIPIGIIYGGTQQDQSDEAWLSIAGERVKRYELQTGGRPDQVLFQSWDDKPDHVLPESDPYTFTGFIRTYFEDKSALGFRQGGQGANLAYQKSVRASAVDPQHPAAGAVDGDSGTWWGAASMAPQWIEIDLGAAHNIQEIRLMPSMYPDGRTINIVKGKGPGTNGAFVTLYTFDGQTKDGQVLSYKPPEPWKGIQVVRVQTTVSPSWVAWREIEIVDAGE